MFAGAHVRGNNKLNFVFFIQFSFTASKTLYQNDTPPPSHPLLFPYIIKYAKCKIIAEKEKPTRFGVKLQMPGLLRNEHLRNPRNTKIMDFGKNFVIGIVDFFKPVNESFSLRNGREVDEGEFRGTESFELNF